MITEWAMYTDEGDRLVDQMMAGLHAALKAEPLPNVRERLQTEMKALASLHGEVYDTEVRDSIASESGIYL